jgi:hypothetical protein
VEAVGDRRNDPMIPSQQFIGKKSKQKRKNRRIPLLWVIQNKIIKFRGEFLNPLQFTDINQVKPTVGTTDVCREMRSYSEIKCCEKYY